MTVSKTQVRGSAHIDEWGLSIDAQSVEYVLIHHSAFGDVVQRFPYTPTPGTDVNATIETLVSLRVPEHVATQLLFRLNAGNAGQPSVAQAPRRQEGLLVEGA